MASSDTGTDSGPASDGPASDGPASDGPDPKRGTVELAVTRRPASGAASERVFGFGAPGPALATQLARPSLFCVIADPVPLGAAAAAPDPGRATFANALWLGDWLAKAEIAAVAGATGKTSILILKSCPGTLVERVETPDEWADPNTFSTLGAGDDGLGVQARVKAAVADGIARAQAQDRLYDPFAAIALDPQWTGFLILDAALGTSGLPEPLRMLGADPDAGALALPYLWSAGWDPRHSSLAGLIDYAAQPAAESGAPAGLSLRRLRAGFANGRAASLDVALALSFGGAVAPLSLLARERNFDYGISPAAPGGDYRLDGDGDRPRPLGEWLQGLLAALWSLQAEDGSAEPLSLSLRVDFKSGVADDLAAIVPVLLVERIPLRESSSDAVAEQLTGAILSWAEVQRPSTEDSALTFGVGLSSPSSNPMIALPTLVLGLAKVTFAGDPMP